VKVGLVTTNLRGGGAEKVFLRIGSLLAARGHEVHLVLLEHLVDHAIEPGLELHALTAPGRPCTKGFFGKRLAARRLRRSFRELARGGEFDLVLSTLPFADEVAALASLPRLWHRIANTLSAEIARLEARPAKAERRRTRYRRLYGQANLVAVSQGVADDLRHGLGLAHANIERVYNPFDLATLRRLADEAAPGRPDEPYVVHVGRFAPQKRHDLLLAAWKRAARPEKLVLLAHPDPRLDAMIRAEGLGDRVVVAGFQQNPYPWIKRARLLVLCSDHEGMPNVLVEALACGTPVVSTDCPSGPREILEGPLARWLVPCGDAPRLAETIAAALRDPPSVAGVDLSRFDAQTVVAQLEALPGRWRPVERR
jgi:glycosyltransferase involved in cell wall biosynthesis